MSVVSSWDDPADVGPCNYVLFRVKAYDTRDASGDLTPLLEENTAVVALQNGVDNERWLADDIRVELWRKLTLISAQSGTTAATRFPVGDMREADASWKMYRRLVEEVSAVARAAGVELPAGTVDEWMDFARDFDRDMRSSLHYDLTHDEPLELDALHGSIVRHAAEVGVEVPTNEAIDAILRPWANRNDPWLRYPIRGVGPLLR